MARMRAIKPGFFTNDLLAEIEPLGRLLFAGLWMVADREGRLEDRPRRLKAEILPYDNADIDGLLDGLAERGFLIRYRADGQQLIQVVNWGKHQQPHYKEVASTLPAPEGWVDSPVTTFGVPPTQYERIMERDNWTCQRCGAKDDLTIDHIVPRSRGGSGDDDNLQVLCGRCNSGKGAREDQSTSRQVQSDVESTSDQRRPNVASSTLTLTVAEQNLNLNRTETEQCAPSAPAAAAALPESVERLHSLLFGQKGYAPSPAFLQKVGTKYGGLDLETEGIKLLDWLGSAQNRKSQVCSTRFVLNWLQKATEAPPSAPTRASPQTIRSNRNQESRNPRDYFAAARR